MPQIYFKKMQVEIVSENKTHIKYKVVGKPLIHTMSVKEFHKMYKLDGAGAEPVTDLDAVKASIAETAPEPVVTPEPDEEDENPKSEDDGVVGDGEKFEAPTGEDTATEDAVAAPTAAEKRKATRAAAKAKKAK